MTRRHRRMRYYWFIILFALIAFKTVDAAIPYQDVKKGKEFVYNLDIENGMHYWDSLVTVYPSQPEPYFYRGYFRLIIFSQEMLDMNMLKHMNEDFSRCIETVKQRDDYEKSAELNYYLGISYGSVGIYYLLDKNYLMGFISGRRAKNYLERTVKLDSAYYDAYLGLGIYHYYVGLMPSLMKFFAGLLGFKGNAEQGLAEIKTASIKGDFFKMEALITYNLIQYFFLDNKEQPLKVFAELTAQYPENPLFGMLMGYHYRRTFKPQTALTYFKAIDDKYLNTASQIYFMKYYNMAVSFFRLNQFDSTLTTLQKIIPYSDKMTMYYKSAIRYYSALSLLGKNKRGKALSYLKQIPDRDHTSFWYLSSRLFVENPLPGNMDLLISYGNTVFSENYDKADDSDIIETYFAGVPYSVWNIYFADMKAYKLYRKNKPEEAALIYQNVINKVEDYPGTDYLKGWIIVHYAEVLTNSGSFSEAEDVLKRGKSIDDDYMQLIIQRGFNRINKFKEKSLVKISEE